MDILAVATSILGAVGRACLQGALVIAAVWIVCRLFPRLPASLRCGLWWLACAKLVLGLAWGLAGAAPLRLAVLPMQSAAQVSPSPPTSSPIPSRPPGEGEKGTQAEASAGGWGRPSPGGWEGMGEGTGVRGWQLAVVSLWASGVLLLLGVTVWQHRRARRVVRRSTAVAEPWLSGMFGAMREQLGVPARTAVRLSAEVATPQVLGLVRPVVLLPAAAPARLSRAEIAMTLCHELLHVRRGDLWLGWVPAVAQRLFFFHPLALLAVREYVLAREAACDAEVLRVLDPAPESYGRLLLRLGVAPQPAKLAAAGAAPSLQILKRRLQMLQNAADTKRLHPAWWVLLVLVACLALVPFTITAQEAPPAPAPPEVPEAYEAPEPPEAPPIVEPAEPAEPAEAPEAPAAPAALPSPRTLPAPLPVAHLAQNGAHAAPPAPPVPPTPPTPPTPPRPPHRMHTGDGGSYALLLGGKRTVMSGSTWDIAKARKLRTNDDEQLFWFERGGKEYVIRDAATLGRIKAIFEPQQKLGEKQGELGSRQGELGERQGALGAQQGQQGAKQGELGAKMARLAAEQARLEREGKSTDALAAQMEKLAREQEELSKPQEALGRQQEELGRQQEVLGRQQEELGRQQEELSRQAEKQLKALIDDAVAKGTAREVK